MIRTITLVFITAIYFPTQGITSPLWVSDQESSKITFIASYDGIHFEGEFRKFHAEFLFDTDTPANRYLNSTVDVTSINTNSRDRDQAVAESDWFYFSKFPQATFTSQSVKQLSDDTYSISGIIQIRDQSKEISFPLTWEETESGNAMANASFELDRRDFNIGSGEWEQDETIGFNVVVSIQLFFQQALIIN